MCGIFNFWIFTLAVLLAESVNIPTGLINIGVISRAVQYHEESLPTEVTAFVFTCFAVY